MPGLDISDIRKLKENLYNSVFDTCRAYMVGRERGISSYLFVDGSYAYIMVVADGIIRELRRLPVHRLNSWLVVHDDANGVLFLIPHSEDNKVDIINCSQVSELHVFGDIIITESKDLNETTLFNCKGGRIEELPCADYIYSGGDLYVSTTNGVYDSRFNRLIECEGDKAFFMAIDDDTFIVLVGYNEVDTPSFYYDGKEVHSYELKANISIGNKWYKVMYNPDFDEAIVACYGSLTYTRIDTEYKEGAYRSVLKIDGKRVTINQRPVGVEYKITYKVEE